MVRKINTNPEVPKEKHVPKHRTPVFSQRSKGYRSYIRVPIYYRCYTTLWNSMKDIVNKEGEDGHSIRYEFFLEKLIEIITKERPDILRKLPTDDIMEFYKLWPEHIEPFISVFMNPNIKLEALENKPNTKNELNTENKPLSDLNEEPFNNLFSR